MDGRCVGHHPTAPEAFRKVTRLSQHIAFLKDFFRAYKDFTDAQIDTIEILLSKLYARFGITDSTDYTVKRPTEFPVMEDLYRLCEEEFYSYNRGRKYLYTEETLQEVCLGIHSMCVGAESKYFNGHTNITDSDFLVFGVKGLLDTNKRLKDAMLFNILSFLSNQLLGRGDTAASIDELYLFLTNMTAIEYIRNCMKRVRKKDSSVNSGQPEHRGFFDSLHSGIYEASVQHPDPPVSVQRRADHFGTQATHVGGAYDTYTVRDEQNRQWKLVSDASIRCYHGGERTARREYSVEFVSPICKYEDIPTVQELIRKLRSGGAKVNDSCGIHVHVDASAHTPQTLRNIVNIMASKEDLLYKALQVQVSRERYCQRADTRFLDELNHRRPRTMEAVERLWYNGESGRYCHYDDSRYRIRCRGNCILSGNLHRGAFQKICERAKNVELQNRGSSLKFGG